MIRRGLAALRALGPRWALRRARYLLRLHAGLVRWATPIGDWRHEGAEALVDGRSLRGEAYGAWKLENLSPWCLSAGGPRELPEEWRTEILGRAEAVVRGEVEVFGRLRRIGRDPDWHRPPEGARFPDRGHWSRVQDFGSGDIKQVWEPSRFGLVFPLAQAYARTEDERYAEAFWGYLESWRSAALPNQGALWKCGQEVALRALAWCFGLYAFAPAEATTPVRVARLAEMVEVGARRVHATTDYAVSQQNNHSVTEAAGLLVAGHLFPEFCGASTWIHTARLEFRRAAEELFTEDGVFSQYSANYQRVAMQAFAIGFATDAKLVDEVGSPGIDHLLAAVEMFSALVDPEAGRLPRFGADDGAQILPLGERDPRDMRACIQALGLLLDGRRRLHLGPWDEGARWLGRDPSEAPRAGAAPRSRIQVWSGQFASLGDDDTRAFLILGSFRHRPSQADLLHLELKLGGRTWTLDPGTYSYNAPAPWGLAMGSTRAHNSMSVSGSDQMERPLRFLWAPWARATFEVRLEEGDLLWAEASHDGFCERLGVTHRRSVVRLGPAWLVVDTLEGGADRPAEVGWLFPDVVVEAMGPGGPWRLRAEDGAQLEVRVGSLGASRAEWFRAGDSPFDGWTTTGYLARAPAQRLRVHLEPGERRSWTLLSEQAATVQEDSGGLLITLAETGESFEVRWEDPGPGARIKWVRRCSPRPAGPSSG